MKKYNNVIIAAALVAASTFTTGDIKAGFDVSHLDLASKRTTLLQKVWNNKGKIGTGILGLITTYVGYQNRASIANAYKNLMNFGAENTNLENNNQEMYDSISKCMQKGGNSSKCFEEFDKKKKMYNSISKCMQKGGNSTKCYKQYKINKKINEYIDKSHRDIKTFLSINKTCKKEVIENKNVQRLCEEFKKRGPKNISEVTKKLSYNETKDQMCNIWDKKPKKYKEYINKFCGKPKNIVLEKKNKQNLEQLKTNQLHMKNRVDQLRINRRERLEKYEQLKTNQLNKINQLNQQKRIKYLFDRRFNKDAQKSKKLLELCNENLSNPNCIQNKKETEYLSGSFGTFAKTTNWLFGKK